MSKLVPHQVSGAENRRPPAIASGALGLKRPIEELLKSDAEVYLSGLDLIRTTGPGVYLLLDGAGKPVYVGAGSNCLQRAALSFSAKSSDCTIVHAIIYPCRSVEAAFALETMLIGRLRPRFNLQDRSGSARARTTESQLRHRVGVLKAAESRRAQGRQGAKLPG